ncbi:TonB-dependent receptor [Henriciella sp.]|uniref:TonB-dependent receptor n=1 Tax=Henriciella sp. TaxID=1968823 RepID=UPI0026023C5B|nr:TonB-dependent receptor [Henriciella sp.]
MGKTMGLRQRLLAAVVMSVAGGGEVLAQAEVQELRLEAAPLGEALRAFSAQTGQPVLFSGSLVAGHMAPAVQGTMSGDAALERLLAGTGLEAVEGPGDALVIRAVPAVPVEAHQDEAPVRTPVPRRPGVARDEPAVREESDLRIDTVKVTGTSLRGFAPESSPLLMFDRDDLLRSGATSTEQFIRQLPQNFKGGSTEFASGGLPNDKNSAQNYTFGTGANLRGLGSRGTLVLLNGNRLAPTSAIGDFVDLSLIPLSALDRVDVLTDGASAIYGGDAVAGVINFVLRDDYEGSETSLRYGSVTDGDMEEIRASQTFGTAWNSGNVIATYEYYLRDELTLAERPGLAAPPLQTGDPIAQREAFDLLPEQERNSGVVSLRQELGPQLSLSGTGLYSRREVSRSTVFAGAAGIVTRSDTSSESVALSAGADYDLSASWRISSDITYNRIRNNEILNRFDGRGAPPTVSDFSSDLLSFDLQLDGDVIDLPGGTVKAAIGTQLREETFDFETRGFGTIRDGRRDVTAVYGEVLIPLVGPGNAMTGIERLDINLSGRWDDYSDFGSSANPKIGLLWAPADGLNLRSSYSESFAPPTVGQSGALDRIAAVLSYDFIRGVYGIDLPDPSLDGVNLIQVNGTADDLDPETSRTFTAGFDYEARAGRQDWSLSSSYYDIDFENRLGTTPVPGNLNLNFAPGLAFDNPDLFPPGTITFFPSEAEIDALLASLSRPIIITGGATALENIGFINRVSQTRNLASTRTRGLDLRLTYRADTDEGLISAGLNANYIIDFVQQAAQTTPEVEALNTLYSPVDLQARASLGFARGGFTGNFFVNYTAGYRTDNSPSARRIGSWTTADLSLAYEFDVDAPGLLSGTVFDLSLSNLFDEAPPNAPTASRFGITSYDPANASPIGRFVAVGLRKSF